MATATYTLIDSTTLGSSASTVTFSSIPTGGDLAIVVDTTLTGGASINFRLNNDSGSNYSFVLMRGSSSAADASDSVNTTQGTFGYSVGKSLAIVDIFDYSATDKHKSVLSKFNNSTYVFAHANRWADTSAVNRIDFILTGGESFAAGSTFYLYNIAKAL
tara:strand:+ start:432 stop:911 length:480 start_codon:yes stop_codon:yes gene_type:complete